MIFLIIPVFDHLKRYKWWLLGWYNNADILFQWINVEHFRQVSSVSIVGGWSVQWSPALRQWLLGRKARPGHTGTITSHVEQRPTWWRGLDWAGLAWGCRQAAAASDRLGRAESVQSARPGGLGTHLRKQLQLHRQSTDFLEITKWLSSAEFWIPWAASWWIFSNVWKESSSLAPLKTQFWCTFFHS